MRFGFLVLISAFCVLPAQAEPGSATKAFGTIVQAVTVAD